MSNFSSLCSGQLNQILVETTQIPQNLKERMQTLQVKLEQFHLKLLSVVIHEVEDDLVTQGNLRD